MVKEKINNKINWPTLLSVIIGGVMTLIGSIVTQLYLVPMKEIKTHQYALVESKLSKLYQPLLLATGYGNFSITSDIPFWKVYSILENYGYLADADFMGKYVEFLKFCRFARYDDLKEGGLIQRPLPESIIVEIIKQGKPPLKWDADSLENALKIEKEFTSLLIKFHEKAFKDFKSR
jgi:hypothetical protein